MTKKTAIYYSKLQNNKWTPAKKADFTNGRKNEEIYPFVSLDGERIYFTAMDSIFSDEKIWYVNRLEDSWSEAKLLDSPINDDLVFYINQAKNGKSLLYEYFKRYNVLCTEHKRRVS